MRKQTTLKSNTQDGVVQPLTLFFGFGNKFILTNFGDVQFSHAITGDVYFNVLPLKALNDEIDKESHLPSPEGEVLRGTHYYYAGYEMADSHFMVVDIDLDKLFPNAVNWSKK